MGSDVVGEVQDVLGDLVEVLVEENVVSAGLGEFNAHSLVVDLQDSNAEFCLLGQVVLAGSLQGEFDLIFIFVY